ncbi:MAG: NUDIX hydrolase [Paludibacteraceae bacterium]
MSEEIFPIVNDNAEIIGSATRSECHSGSFLLHPVVHLHVFNEHDALYLQKRADNKDIQPGMWDTAVGGHVNLNETVFDALQREAYEELNINTFEPVFAFRCVFESKIERELVHSFFTYYSDEIIPNPAEISEGKFWKFEEIEDNLGKMVFTPNFESEFEKIKAALLDF